MTLRKADARDARLIENLFNLYRNDLSPYAPEFRGLDGEGYFEWGISEQLLPFGDGVETYIISEDGLNLGLIVVTDARYAPEDCAWRFQELYLIRPARGKGLARQAALTLLNERPGRWCLSVYDLNVPARRFWESLIAERGILACTAPGEENMTDYVFDVFPRA